MKIIATALLASALLASAAHADRLTPERVYADPDLSGPRARRAGRPSC